MNNTPVFDPSLANIHASTLNIDYWPEVMNIFDQEKFKDAILALLDYINSDIIKKNGNADLTEFTIPHGSLIVHFTIKDGMYCIQAPFLKISDKNAVPLMRQVAELNFSTLVLAQIVAKGDELYFEYSSPLELCEPYKLYMVFQEICTNADYYDDLFIEKFGAKRLTEMRVEHLSDEKMEQCWQKYQEYLKEGLAYCDFFESRRLYEYSADALSIALMKIDYYIAPQGFLRTQIEKDIFAMLGNNALNDIVADAKAAFQKLLMMDRKLFEESIYVAETFISTKTRIDLQGIQNLFENDFKRSKDQIGGTDFMGADTSLLFVIYQLFYRSNIPPDIYNILKTALVDSSNKRWKDGADVLFKAVNSIMEMKLPTLTNVL